MALTTPVFLSSSSFGAYFFWGSASLLCTLACCFVMRETRGRSLEVIEKEYLDKHEESMRRTSDDKKAEKKCGDKAQGQTGGGAGSGVVVSVRDVQHDV